MTGTITLSSKVPAAPPQAIGGVVADDLRAHLQHRLGHDRVHLAGHDRRARLQVGQVQLAEPGARPGAHPAQVVADLGQADRDDAQLAGQLDQRVARGLRLQAVLARPSPAGR